MLHIHEITRRLNTRATRATTDKLQETGKLLHGKNTALRQQSSNGWYHSWYIWRASVEGIGSVAPLHESLHIQADELLEQLTRQNEKVILMSAYVAAIVTYTDSCRTMLHHYLPPFLHTTLKEMGIGMDTQTKPYPFPLNPQEQEGKEILYSYALLEMTGT
jgi:hypothetical protein